ncbi:uncharacterized protein LOC131226738 [Magnolia sinica]|uniref:uncharacterized protein LOC131226738 n=1 Tax=Magnolia sinica TaxID=86752 RepID=UPI00265B19A5|nr:uncharacterized protein LOC131226738 [Magnolia sinica]
MAEEAHAEIEELQHVTSEPQHVTYKLVPWLNWDEWNYVRKSLFSPSPDSVAAALRRISAWQARGPLPVAVEVTAAIIEVRQKDPSFGEGLANDAMSSDEMLAMSYCMAIIRLVNGFVEKSCKEMRTLPFKKKGVRLSISVLAEEIGIPRMLVDIRHEGSHRGLPSLPLVRSASVKALDWLKSKYWEPQRKAIPNVRKETKSRMREMVFSLNVKQARRSEPSQSKGKRAKSAKHTKLLSGRFSHVAMHQCSKAGGLSVKNIGFKKPSTILGSLIRLYSTFPLKVVAVLLEEFLLKISYSRDAIEVAECGGNSQVEIIPGDPKSRVGTIGDWKAIITRLSSKEPALLLTMVEEVLGMIEARENMKFETGDIQIPTSKYRAEIHQIENLSSLLPWLLKNLKEAKGSGPIQSKHDTPLATSEAMLPDLLRKCLALLTPGNTHLLDSVLLLAEMIGKNSLTERLKKLMLSSTPDPDLASENTTGMDLERALVQEEDSINRAAKRLEFLKLHRAKGKTVNTESCNGNMERRPWTVARSWSKCPIGMLPRAFGSSGVLPVLDWTGSNRLENERSIEKEDCSEGRQRAGKREASCDIQFLEDSSVVKKIRETVNIGGLEGRDDSRVSLVEGRLMIGGVWKKVGEEELRAIESGIRILV